MREARTDEDDAGFLEAWLGAVRRRWPWMVGVAAAVLLVALAVVLLARPVYRAEALLRLGAPPPSGGVSPSAGVFSFLRPGGDPFANDLELLASRSLMERVVVATASSVELHAPPGWHRDSIFTALSVADSTVEARWTATWTGPATVRVERVAPEDSLVGSFESGRPVTFGGVTAVFREARPGAPGSVDLTTLPLDEAVRELSGRIEVERTRQEANVVAVEHASTDPGQARAVVAATVEAFLELRSRLFREEGGRTADSLRAVARTTEVELREAEDSLEAFQRREGLVAPDAQGEALVERHALAVQALDALRSELRVLGQQLRRVEVAEDPSAAWTTLVAHPAFLENETAGDFLTRLTVLEERRTELRSRQRPETRAVRTLEAQIDQLDRALRSLAAEYRTALEDRLEEARSRVAETEALLEGVPERVVELGRRQRRVRILGELLVLTEQRLRQEDLREALSSATAQVIDPPAVRYRPVWPRRKLGAAVGLLLAVVAGGAAGAFMERADGTVRRARRLREVAGVEVVAAPLLEGGRLRLSRAQEELFAELLGPETAVVPCGGGREAAEALLEAAPGEAKPPLVTVGDPADAAGIAREGRSALLVVRAGRTELGEAARVAGELARAGVEVSGAVLACGRRAEVEEAWS